jgi:hypothetical protein
MAQLDQVLRVDARSHLIGAASDSFEKSIRQIVGTYCDHPRPHRRRAVSRPPPQQVACCGRRHPLGGMGQRGRRGIRRRHPRFKKSPAKDHVGTTVLSNANPPDKNVYAFSPGNTIQTHSECRIAPRSLGECGIAARFLDCEWAPTPRPNQLGVPAPLLLDYRLPDGGRPPLLFDHGLPNRGRRASVDGLDRLADRGL